MNKVLLHVIVIQVKCYPMITKLFIYSQDFPRYGAFFGPGAISSIRISLHGPWQQACTERGCVAT